MVTRRTLVLVPLAGLAITAGCSSSGGSGGSAPAPPATGKALSAQTTSLGKILVDGRGHTVYVFANDKPNASSCTGACAADWPPVAMPAKLPASLPGVQGKVGSTKRSDGSRQLTVAGHPVYTFTGDSAAGQTNGQGITLNGGLWTVVLPSGAPDTSAKGGSGSVPGYTAPGI